MDITNLYELSNILRIGPYAWPGGYPIYFLMADGETCSFDAINDNRGEVFASFEEGGDKAWRPVAVAINWEDHNLYCAHTGEHIEAAYDVEDA